MNLLIDVQLIKREEIRPSCTHVCHCYAYTLLVCQTKAINSSHDLINMQRKLIYWKLHNRSLVEDAHLEAIKFKSLTLS